MKAALQLLEKHLKTRRPAYYAKLQTGLTETALGQLEAQYHISLPPDLKTLYQWKNGQSSKCYASFVNNSMFAPLESALKTKKLLTEMIGLDFEIENWWNENWLPIFSNGGGSAICYDLGGVFTGDKGQLIEFWNDDNDRKVIAPRLLDLIECLNQYFKDTTED
ncbi:MAG: SMI1/KNR4 family protein, partial [Bacteroidota bacterium]